jgi:hypothetical protein
VPIARINNRLIYFSHVPKTGGTSIEAYLRQKGPVALVQAGRSTWARSSAQHMEAAVADEFFRDGFCDARFAVLREPKARLISEYKMRRTIVDEHLRGLGPWKSRLRKLVKSVTDRRNPTRDGIPSFDTWVRRVFAVYPDNPYVHDNHIRPQVEFVGPDYRLFRFEDGLTPVLRWIDEVTDTPPGDTGFHLVKGTGSEVVCSASTDALIRQFYRADYDLIETLAAGR